MSRAERTCTNSLSLAVAPRPPKAPTPVWPVPPTEGKLTNGSNRRTNGSPNSHSALLHLHPDFDGASPECRGMIRLHSSASKGQGTKTMETGGRGARLPTTTARVIPSSPFNAIHYSTYILGGAGVHWRCKLQVGTGATATAPVSSQLSLSVVSRVLSYIAQGAPPCSCSAGRCSSRTPPAGGGSGSWLWLWLRLLAWANLGPALLGPGSWAFGPWANPWPLLRACDLRSCLLPSYFLLTLALALDLGRGPLGMGRWWWCCLGKCLKAMASAPRPCCRCRHQPAPSTEHRAPKLLLVLDTAPPYTTCL
jgi:hypothetical protein